MLKSKLISIFTNPLLLSSKGDASAVQAFLLNQDNPTVSALNTTGYASESLRKDVVRAVLDEGEFSESVVDLLNWQAETGNFSNEAENQGFGDYLEYFYEDFEEVDTDEDKIEFLSELIASGLPLPLGLNLATEHFEDEGILNAFPMLTKCETYLKEGQKFKYEFVLATLEFEHRNTSYVSLLETALESEIHKYDCGTLEEFAKTFELDSLKWYAKEGNVLDMNLGDYRPDHEKDNTQEAVIALAQQTGSSIIAMTHKLVSDLVGRAEFSCDSDLYQQCELFLLEPFSWSSQKAAELFADCLVDPEGLNLESDLQIVQLRAEEQGARDEASEAVYSYLPNDTRNFTINSEEHFILDFDLEIEFHQDEIVSAIMSADYPEDLLQQDMDDFLKDHLENEGVDDLDVPYYGWSGFTNEEYQLQLHELLLEELEFLFSDSSPDLPMAA